MIYDLKHPPIFGPLWSCSIHFHPIKSIQSYQVHIGPIRFTLAVLSPLLCILSTLVLFGPLWLYWVHSILSGSLRSILSTLVLFSPLWSYLVHIAPIRSTLFIFSQLWSYLVHSIHLGSICSYSVHLGPAWSIYSYSVHIGHFCPLWSIRSYSVNFVPIRSTLVIFGPIWFIQSYSIYFSPFQSTSLYSVFFCALT